MSDRTTSLSQFEIRPMIGKSILFHILLFAFFTVKSFIFPSHEEIYLPSVKVDLVALPEKTAPKQAAKAPPKPPVQIQKTAKSSKKIIPKKNKVDTAKALERMSSLERIESMVENETLKENTPKAKPKDNLIRGNRISPGTSLKGLSKLDYDSYRAKLEVHAKNNWELPKWLASGQLTADIQVHLDERGYVIKKNLLKSSGDKGFDDSVMAAIDRASPFPAPEDKFVDLVSVSGIVFTLEP